MHRVKTFPSVGIWPFTAHWDYCSSLKYFHRCSSPSVFSVRPMIFCTDYLNIHWAGVKYKNDYVNCFFRCSSGQDILIQTPVLSQPKIELCFHRVPGPHLLGKVTLTNWTSWQVLVSYLHISECFITLIWDNKNLVGLSLSYVSQWMTDLLTV